MSKRKYGAWSESDMERALAAYRNGDVGFNECCRQYGIPKPTLKRHLDCKNVIANDSTKVLGRTTTLPLETENELVGHILKMEELLFGVTINDVRKLAYQIAEHNNIPHNFNRQTQMAGKKWFYGFRARHKELTLREPEATSMARARGFNKENVGEFFDILKRVIDENAIDATRLFNVDETGVSTVQNKCQKVLAKKGKRQVGSVSSGERGVNTTVVCCTSASGSYVPPMIIFKRMRMANELKVGAPPGGLVEVSESGYINSALFVQWMKHFVDTVKPSVDKRVLLLLDGHTTHSKNLEALQIARENGVIMLQLPGHTTHRIQPLDRTFFKPLKGYYTLAIEKWLRTNPGLCVTQYHVATLVAEAYGKAATIENSINGFRCTGIWPLDNTVLKDCDFAPAEYLNQTDDPTPTNENCVSSRSTEDATPESFGPDSDENNALLIEKQSDETSRNVGLTSPTACRSKLTVPIESISPIPRPNNRRRLAKSQRALILTSSPYKNDLELAKKLQVAQATVKELKMQIAKDTPKDQKLLQPSVKKRKLNTTRSTTKEDPSSAITAKVLAHNLGLHQPSTSTQGDKPVDIEVGLQGDDWYCYICEEKFVEDMVQCLVCASWVHESCAGVKSGLKHFVCIDCK